MCPEVGGGGAVVVAPNEDVDEDVEGDGDVLPAPGDTFGGVEDMVWCELATIE